MMATAAFATLLTTVVGVLSQDPGSGYDSPDMMTYVLAGWGLTVLGIAIYAVLTIRKGRQLARRLPPDQRRWMS